MSGWAWDRQGGIGSVCEVHGVWGWHHWYGRCCDSVDLLCLGGGGGNYGWSFASGVLPTGSGKCQYIMDDVRCWGVFDI